jgi:hypothetical protein
VEEASSITLVVFEGISSRFNSTSFGISCNSIDWLIGSSLTSGCLVFFDFLVFFDLEEIGSKAPHFLHVRFTASLFVVPQF